MNRREFFRTAAAGTAPLLIPSGAFGKKRKLGANDRIRVGFIGLGGRARWLIGSYDLPDYEIAAVADCFLPRCFEAAKLRPDGEKWARYQDYRRMLDKEKLDAVFVETTTHARVLIAMHALDAGLDVYAEKPLALTVAEGRALAKAVRKRKRVLQTGTQQRSMPMNMYASKLIREGAIGRVQTVIACNFLPPLRWEPKPEQPVPDGLDWEQWCNQTELRPYHRDLQFKWADWRDYDGGGQSWGVSGWGTHALDQVQSALGTDETGPVEVWPEEPGPNGRVTLRYANGTLLKLEQPKIDDHQQLGAIFVGEKGKIQILRGNAIADPPELLTGAPDPTPEGPGEDAPHLKNFFECMRNRKKPNADVEIAHRSTTVCHLVNICRELGRKLTWNPEAEKFSADAEANALLSRPRRKGYELPKV
jgi:predicted dehydrogenase